jgi:hypothetical protein
MGGVYDQRGGYRHTSSLQESYHRGVEHQEGQKYSGEAGWQAGQPAPSNVERRTCCRIPDSVSQRSTGDVRLPTLHHSLLTVCTQHVRCVMQCGTCVLMQSLPIQFPDEIYRQAMEITQAIAALSVQNMWLAEHHFSH